jgi:hypothetical protein
MPPVSEKLSAFSVNSERWTASRQGPWSVHRSAQRSQKSSVVASAISAANGVGGGRCDGP